MDKVLSTPYERLMRWLAYRMMPAPWIEEERTYFRELARARKLRNDLCEERRQLRAARQAAFRQLKDVAIIRYPHVMALGGLSDTKVTSHVALSASEAGERAVRLLRLVERETGRPRHFDPQLLGPFLAATDFWQEIVIPWQLNYISIEEVAARGKASGVDLVVLTKGSE